MVTAPGKEHNIDQVVDEGRDLRDSINGSLINVGVVSALMMALSGTSESSETWASLLLTLKTNRLPPLLVTLSAKFTLMERQSPAFVSGSPLFRSEYGRRLSSRIFVIHFVTSRARPLYYLTK